MSKGCSRNYPQGAGWAAIFFDFSIPRTCGKAQTPTSRINRNTSCPHHTWISSSLRTNLMLLSIHPLDKKTVAANPPEDNFCNSPIRCRLLSALSKINSLLICADNDMPTLYCMWPWINFYASNNGLKTVRDSNMFPAGHVHVLYLQECYLLAVY